MNESNKQAEANRALQNFLDAVYSTSHSYSSVHGYGTAIKGKKNGFRKFLDECYSINEIQLRDKIGNNEIDVYNVLSDYVIFLSKSEVYPRTVKQWFSAVKSYLTYIGIEIYNEKCKQRVRLPKIHKIRKEPLTRELIVRALNVLPFKLRIVFYVAIASGMRIGEIAELRLSDIDFGNSPTRIFIRAETTKTREDRETFLTAEATNALKDYLNRYFSWKENDTNVDLQNVKIFGRTSLARRKIMPKKDEQRGSVDILEQSLNNYLKNIPHLNMKMRNGKRLIHYHALREFFYTTVSNIAGSNFAHALMGHHSYLDTYYSLPEKEKIKMYQKCEPHLTMSDFAKIEEEIEKTKEKQVEIEETYVKLAKFLKEKDPSFERFLELIT
ncbi:site-specific integrase [Nitrosopumilus sp. K4]|uniref:site-specific integrase n=1 Tax=Nitrosopumilus sp. K4 TaxID=2795383 RepID=UPI001BA856E0|nr:site-specific integrase [Nitrosopumilus sp. K4]QUC64373.1 site-specific integrase [Nitrosopumilus sp. K4]